MEDPKIDVADVRRSLSSIRKAWDAQTPSSPLFISDSLDVGTTISDFCFTFVLGHHTKRKEK